MKRPLMNTSPFEKGFPTVALSSVRACLGTGWNAGCPGFASTPHSAIANVRKKTNLFVISPFQSPFSNLRSLRKSPALP